MATETIKKANLAKNPSINHTKNSQRRALKACLYCRARRVRCDASRVGQPCSNCYLDSEPCKVTGRVSKYRTILQNDADAQTSYPPYAPRPNPIRAASTEMITGESPGDDQNRSPKGTSGDGKDRPAECHKGVTEAFSPEEVTGSNINTFFENTLWTPGRSCDGDLSHMVPCDFSPGPYVVYCSYPFLVINNLHNVPSQDVNFLEHQSCLRVPIRPLLEDLVREYFLHVHPIVPLLSEGDFWDLFACGDGRQFRTDGVSLLLLQSMLFSCCNFVSTSTMKSLGFSSIRSLRATFYRRAKLLHDMGTETSHVILAQAALLLSFANFSSAKTPNLSWLNAGIENARSAEAHLYNCTTSSSLSEQRERATLKRLWWCCIIRDRTVGLLIRHPIKITRDHFDFGVTPLGYTDLEDEFDRSRVYDGETKRILAKIFAHSVRLYLALTDILPLCFPLDGSQYWKQQTEPADARRLKESKQALHRWYSYAISHFQGIAFQSPEATESPKDPSTHYGSIILHRNLMLMHYHASRAILCHHEILHLDVLRGGHGSITEDLSKIFHNRTELHDAATSITACLQEVVNIRVARWLPITAIGCTALPLILNILDIKLAPPVEGASHGDFIASAPRQRRLNTLIEIMKTWKPQYDGVDWMSEIVQHIVELAQLDTEPPTRNSMIDWTDILSFQPGFYLRLALTLDFSLSRGRLPQDVDFPRSLRGLFMVGKSPIEGIISTSFLSNQNPAEINFPEAPVIAASETDFVFDGEDIFGSQASLDFAAAQLAGTALPVPSNLSHTNACHIPSLDADSSYDVRDPGS